MSLKNLTNSEYALGCKTFGDYDSPGAERRGLANLFSLQVQSHIRHCHILPSQFARFAAAAAAAAELASDKVHANGDADAGGGGGEEVVISSKAVVEELYRALERGDGDAVRRLLNPDVDWWFHGPRAHQHLVLMRLLTGGGGGGGGGGGLPFKVRAVDAFGETVLAEGTDATGKLYWVHAWTVGPGGRVTGVREYCNTALVVTRLGGGGRGKGAEATAAPPCSQSQQVWQSRLPDRARKNLPALVLAI
uniref:Wound-induced protein 1 n=1 Tax=Oryza punctata TaxID=4537 RepID=A0A0E0L174_ORYPU